MQECLGTEDLNSVTRFLFLFSIHIGFSLFVLLISLFSFSFADQEMSKFINYCNEVKAATAANKEGGQLSFVKPQSESTSGAKK